MPEFDTFPHTYARRMAAEHDRQNAGLRRELRITQAQLDRQRYLAREAARILRSIRDLGPEGRALVAQIEADQPVS